MFRLWWNDVPVAQEGMVDGLVDIPVLGYICQPLYCWYSESCSDADRYGRYFRKTFFIMFAKHHFIIEWCLADKILPQNAHPPPTDSLR